MNKKFEIEVAAENAILLRFECKPSDELLVYLVLLQKKLHQKFSEWLVDSIPSYNTLFIQYDPLKVDHFSVMQAIRAQLASISGCEARLEPTSLIRLPVWYDTANHFDFLDVCQQTKLSESELINLHSDKIYRVYAIGFLPGFAFLGSLHEKLQLPRKPLPRTLVPKGAVAIASSQTAVYPEYTPGGWNIIGRCPYELNTIEPKCNIQFNIGDKVQFYPIDEPTYLSELEGHK